ncbi:SsrA-binding protein SmpB [Candidatus Lariskella endosymbiont of Hedychridium roseum]|uniref:SsrA-binding protein SmpB n=1 Tax=Candidatus Lariskella endosymbiont of Hedychridium roseum TaxID=3077949 RepID=UPI0030CC6AD7
MDKNIRKLIAQNKRARYDYFIEQTMEAGIVLTGTEVKSLRNGKVSISESHATQMGGEIYLLNAHIPEYTEGNRFNHYPLRPRKLLLHASEIKKFIGLIKKKGVTLVPLNIYFNHRNRAKVSLGVAVGKKQHDKRETIKQRDWEREKARQKRIDANS